VTVINLVEWVVIVFITVPPHEVIGKSIGVLVDAVRELEDEIFRVDVAGLIEVGYAVGAISGSRAARAVVLEIEDAVEVDVIVTSRPGGAGDGVGSVSRQRQFRVIQPGFVGQLVHGAPVLPPDPGVQNSDDHIWSAGRYSPSPVHRRACDTELLLRVRVN
jgi:hypothetical protein